MSLLLSGLLVAAASMAYGADAGPLSEPPPGVAFVDNLVPNATFNEGTDAPAGWRIEGDNANGAAVWQDGDAFSGRRSLKIDDRGPYVRSDEDNPSVYVSGGRGGGGSRGWSLGAHREEVSARWVSKPSPAQAGAVYQTMAFMQFANQDQYDQVDVHRAVNPVRIQFLDAAGKVLPYPSAQDWLHNEWPLTGPPQLFAPANPRSKPLKLRLQNYIADPRQLEIRCEIVDWRGQHIFEETLSATLPPFGTTAPSLTYPDELPLGAYTISYVVREAGVDQDQGFTRFAVLAKRETTPEERGRMDYAFSIFAPFFPLIVGYPEEEMIGQMYDAAGVGSTWYSSKTGAGYGVTDLAGLVSIKDPAARQQAVEQFIAESREVTAAWRRYGVKPMGRFTAGIPEDERPILAEVVTQLVTALKNDIRDWQWAQSGRDAPVWENYRVAYEAAKAADPECRFGLGANMDGARQFLQNHGADQLDTLGHVMQGSAHLRWPPMLEEMEKAGEPDMPTFFPIFSVVRPPNSGPDHLQEERDSVRVMVTYWVSVLNSFPNVFSIKQYSLNWNGNQTHSLAHFNRVRPQFAAYAAMTNILGAGRFIEHHELPGAVMYVRERSARPGLVAVLWSTGPEYGVPSDRSKDARKTPAAWGAEPEAVVKIEVGSESVELADVMGNRRTLATPGGVATIPLTPWPQYLIGASVLRPLP